MARNAPDDGDAHWAAERTADAMSWLPARPSMSRAASRWKRYIRALEQMPPYVPGVEDALADARRCFKWKVEQEAAEE